MQTPDDANETMTIAVVTRITVPKDLLSGHAESMKEWVQESVECGFEAMSSGRATVEVLSISRTDIAPDPFNLPTQDVPIE